MDGFDYVIVGAGAAGCVLANRLSEDPGTRVLLIEAGGWDRSPFVRVPKAFARLMDDPRTAWHYPATIAPGRHETWQRGRLIGGSTAINGMVWSRGAAADWDALAPLGWGWSTMGPIFAQLEDHPARDTDGPVRLSVATGTDPLCEEMLETGAELGWRRADDLDADDGERIGYVTATIHAGRRVTAADAFLHPVRQRPNLTVAVDTVALRLLVEGGRAVGVRVAHRGREVDHRAAAEVILAAGALATPQLLQVSGIGPADTLRAAGVPVLLDRPRVGAGLREHRPIPLQYRLAEPGGYNARLGSPLGQARAALRWLATRGGPLALPVLDVAAHVRSRPELDRPDVHLLMAPFSAAPPRPGRALELEREPGLLCLGTVTRPDSEGSLAVTDPDPRTPPAIVANYFATAHDRRVAVDAVRLVRELFATGPIAKRIAAETLPGPAAQTDEEIIEAGRTHGYCGYHAIGTCAMGTGDDHVVDPQLRVRGVDGLRVVDASVLPAMVSGWTSAPVTALAWRAADLILGRTTD
ncbi:GMC family oxidoreductase N-terminal domain-containing protein [Micromonospora halotolerans]|uniref:GMC family oxidoreductase N-terminal domain-containing protein n=1 Tax=Micromonospora halotolerans TaxID=709879 RepID=A0ABY9ZQV9_9ACTN|nr:GMC family oxidoreductase N-terminal domain-containing protein [Micromonospora halotolerans]WNM37682.1 GMC family oxidoreductase N-terminal domain-containing protein [Micromonospora halotolerans]